MPARTSIATISLVALLVGCGQNAWPTRDGTRDLEIATDAGTIALRVEIADTDDERRQGLMGRTSLGAGRGMAFVWDEAVESSFWMKDTLIPLSIAFWNERGRIIGIADMRPCRQDDCPTYGPGEPFVGALEVNLGFFDEHGVSVGDRVTIRTAR